MALTDKLSAIGTAIRNKTGKTALMTLDEMPTEIAGISGGNEPTDADLTFGWDLSKWNYQGTWDNIISKYGNRITTHDVTSFSDSFLNSGLTNIPFAINQKSDSQNVNYSSAFWGCQQLTTCPTINNFKPQMCDGMFGICGKLESIPLVVDWSEANSYTDIGYAGAAQLFMNCSRLRTIDPSWFDCDFVCYSSSSIYYNGFCGCKSLDELVGVPVFTKSEWTDNAFESFVSGYSIDSVCNRLKKLTFKTNDGTAIVAKWAKQHIKMQRVGTFYSEMEATDLGFTGETKVTDDTTYQALKNNPDWWTDVIQYSRYNHNSVVETINSLPDTSAFVNQQIAASGESFADVSNLLDFSGFSTMGSSTDGGAISNLTESEIAVATSKGWTIAM